MNTLEILAGDGEWIPVIEDIAPVRNRIMKELMPVTFDDDYVYFVRRDNYGGAKVQVYRVKEQGK